MIKFKQILEKAASRAGAGAALSPLLIGVGVEPWQRRAEPQAAEAVAVVEELLASTATVEPEQPRPPAIEVSASAASVVTEAVTEAVPSTGGTEVSEPTAAPAEPAAESQDEKVISDSLIASVLEEIHEGGEAAAKSGEPQPAAAAREAPQPETEPREAHPAEGKKEEGPSSEAVIEGMINDAFTSIEQAEEEKKAAIEKAQEAFADAGTDAGSPTRAIDDSFISEVDKLLSAFGNANDFLGTDDAAKSAESVLEEVSEIAAEAANADKAGLPDEAAELAQATSSTAEAAFDISFADTLAQEEEESPTGRILGKAFDVFSSPRKKKAKAAPGDAGGSSGADKSAKDIHDAFDESAEASPASSEDIAEIVSREEKDALFDEGRDDAPGDEMAQIEEELDAAALVKTPAPSSGEPAEVALDFSGAIAPDDAADAPQEKTEDLLSKVLADLDRLGPVEKPEKEKPPEEERPAKRTTQDFTEILSELNSEQARGAGAAAANAAVNPKAVEVSTESRSEEELIDEAMNAGDEPVETFAKPADDASAEEAASDERAASDRKAGVVIARRPPDGAKSAQAGSADEDIIEDAFADDGDDKGAGAGGAAETVSPQPPAKEEKPAEEEVQDETTLLANLEASMETAAQKAREEAAKRAVVREPESVAGGAQAGAAPRAAGEKHPVSAEAEEERVRRQVLDRSKEVEQKVLDDVFGEKKKNYKAEVKAELENMDDGREARRRGKDPRDTMLSADSSGAFSGTLEQSVRAPRVFDGHFGVFWLAWRLNKPFVKYMDPSALKLVGILALVLLGTSLAWLAAAIYKILHGS